MHDSFVHSCNLNADNNTASLGFASPVFLASDNETSTAGLIEPYRHVRLHRRNIQACNVPSNPRRHGKTWPSPICSYIPICQTCWQPPAMPSWHCETICQWVWLSVWRMAEGWMRMRRTSASLHVHPPSEYIH